MKEKRQPKKSRYILRYGSQLKLVIIRGVQRVKGDKVYTIIHVAAAIIQSLIIGSLFYNIPNTTSGAFSRGGAIFFALLYNALSALAEISNAFQNRPILLKQKGYSFYHPSVEALQSILSDLPVKVVTLIVFSIILYFMVGLTTAAGQFFFFLLVLILACFAITSLFQMIAALTKSPSTANSIAGVGVLILSVYSGYMIAKPNMHPWFSWLFWLDPLAYGFESLMANEFHGLEMPCDLLVPSGPGYENITIANQVCAFAGSTAGESLVDGNNYLYAAFRYKWSHAWRNVGIIIGFWLGFLVINCLATEYLRPVSGGGDVLLYKRGHMPEHSREEAEAAEVAAAAAAAENGLKLELSNDGSSKEVFSWQHVNYVIPIDGGHRKLLDDVQGYVKPGTMTALMGESGAGKTTLLNVLSQRINFGVITGDMLVNGKPLDSSFQRRTGYVQQQDLHLAESSVRESLQFAARLRQPASTPDSEKLAYVEKIIGLLGMGAYAEAIVGSAGRGLNVEQRKKLSIGVELVAKPSLLLFLDEPSSGLDGPSSSSIIKLLRSLADEAGQSILCTIHQPSATLFEEFDRLLLLKKGGRTVYFGDIGPNSHTLVDYFERNGSRKCESHENPAEYILECIGAGATASVSEDWGDIWNNSVECHNTTSEIATLQRELAAKSVTGTDDKHLSQKFAASYSTQFKYVLLRTMTQYWRSPTYIMAKFMLMVIAGLFIGFTFWNVGNPFSIQGMQDAMFGIFLIQVLSAPLTNQILSQAEQTRELYEVRESSSNTFHWSCLLLSQFISEIPYHIVFSSLLFCCFYFPVQYSTEARVAGYFYFVYCILFQFYYVSFALWISYFSPDAASAAAIASLMFSFLIAFCGVLQPADLAPHFWIFLFRLSPFTYFIQSYLGVTMHNKQVVCKPEEFNIFQPPSGLTCDQFAGPFVKAVGGYINNLNDTSNCQYCRFAQADEYLETIGVNYGQRWRNVGFICAYIIFNICAMLVFYYLFRVKQWQTPKIFSIFKKKPAPEEPVRDIYEKKEGDDELIFGKESKE